MNNFRVRILPVLGPLPAMVSFRFRFRLFVRSYVCVCVSRAWEGGMEGREELVGYASYVRGEVYAVYSSVGFTRYEVGALLALPLGTGRSRRHEMESNGQALFERLQDFAGTVGTQCLPVLLLDNQAAARCNSFAGFRGSARDTNARERLTDAEGLRRVDNLRF